MNNDYKSIHDFDLNLICEFFSNMDRQGPGSYEVTLKALSFIEGLTENSLIADIGSGTGGQTITLARHAKGKIIALDLFPDFINILNNNARVLGFENRVTGIMGNMENLHFEHEELDLIWSEGAIYHIGFERGINEWRDFLKPGGYIAVSESSWFTDERPYPEIDTIPNQLAKIIKAGYLPIAMFTLPETCWSEQYYTPRNRAIKVFLDKYAGNRFAEDFINSQLYEEELYQKYKRFYGYTFFIAKKI
jgi:SAM-dependent methyltransferase